MRNLPNTQVGGTSAAFQGSLKRKLATVPIARLNSSAEGSDFVTQTSRLLLKNLNGDLDIQIAVGVTGADGAVVRPSQYPAPGTAFGTVQLTPVNNFADAQQKLYLRPVFQDPTLPSNQNNPLPQDLPFGWEANTECDEVEIEVVLTSAGWLGEGILDGLIVVEVTVEYTGEWWDPQAIQFALSQVTLLGAPGDLPSIQTVGGGG